MPPQLCVGCESLIIFNSDYACELVLNNTLYFYFYSNYISYLISLVINIFCFCRFFPPKFYHKQVNFQTVSFTAISSFFQFKQLKTILRLNSCDILCNFFFWNWIDIFSNGDSFAEANDSHSDNKSRDLNCKLMIRLCMHTKSKSESRVFESKFYHIEIIDWIHPHTMPCHIKWKHRQRYINKAPPLITKNKEKIYM